MPAVNRINLQHLACPLCKQQNTTAHLIYNNNSLSCMNCHVLFAINNGVPVLLVDPNLESKLEKNPDAEIHQLKDGAIENTYNEWNSLLSEFDANHGAYLEIGSGNGRLSHGVIYHSLFTDISITDLSEVFIQNIISRNTSQRDHLHFYACDANHLPFQANTFDVVVGRSILHHILHYEKTLLEIFNVLKPQGKAFFLEPILQGKLLVAFFLKVMIETDERHKSGIFIPEQMKRIKILIKHLTKAHHTGNNLEVLRHMEDKYIFDIEEIKKLSAQIGFKQFYYRNNCPAGADMANEYPLWGYGNHVFSHIKKFGITREQLAKFDYLFTSFGETFSDHINHQLYTPMGYFIFEK
jgi:ubiquinone/menaquinone biosynthesis C-methylase UbiE/uncharacterized protein YbaR (Trm112 family)